MFNQCIVLARNKQTITNQNFVSWTIEKNVATKCGIFRAWASFINNELLKAGNEYVIKSQISVGCSYSLMP